MARAGSAQVGIARLGSPGDTTAIRPRLNSISSRNASVAFRMTPLIGVPCSSICPAGKRAVRVDVVIASSVVVPIRMIVTCRAVLSHRTTNCGGCGSP